MYNPLESEYYNEWIEIYNNEETPINLSNLTICNEQLLPGYINHSNNQEYNSDYTTIPPNSYLIITDGGSGTEAYNNYHINPNSLAAHTSSGTICGSLNNEEDLIYINSNNNLLDAIHYYKEIGANNNQKTICKINNLWQECDPTPGYPNTNTQSQNYTLTITEFLPDPLGNDTAPMPKGEWIELYNYGTKILDLTGLKIKDKTNHILIISNTTTYNLQLQPDTYTLIYTNGKSGFLNNEGLEEIKLYTPNDILIEKITYSDSKEGESWSKINNTWILTKPSPNKPNPTNPEEGKESKITIEKVYLGKDKSAKFGETIRIKLTIYKGDTTKESIKAYLEKDNKKISKTTTFNIHKKYLEQTITIPIQIYPNCKQEYKPGTYNLVVSGLDTRDNTEIEIKDITKNLCEIKKESCTEENLVTYIDQSGFETIINSNNLSDQIIYESTSKKTTKSGIYFFSLILVLLITHFILEKWKK